MRVKNKPVYVKDDCLSLEERGRFIRISTHRQRIIVNVGPVGCCGSDQEFSFQEFFNLFARKIK